MTGFFFTDSLVAPGQLGGWGLVTGSEGRVEGLGVFVSNPQNPGMGKWLKVGLTGVTHLPHTTVLPCNDTKTKFGKLPNGQEEEEGS